MYIKAGSTISRIESKVETFARQLYKSPPAATNASKEIKKKRDDTIYVNTYVYTYVFMYSMKNNL